MSLTWVTPEIYRGSDATGSDGDSNRVITVVNSDVVSNGMNVVVDNNALIYGTDYSLSGSNITFLNPLFDTSYISVIYAYGTVETPESIINQYYATVEELAGYMGIIQLVPNPFASKTSRTLETVGTGDNTETIFYLNNGFILNDTYTLYYGATADTSTALTETTHYIIDTELGKITLTSAGVTLIGTDNIYAKYSYNLLGLTSDELQDAINRAISEIDQDCNNHFADGTLETPDYAQITNEKQKGQGRYERDYYLLNYPLPNVTTTLGEATVADDTTVTVASTNGFPTSGIIGIGTDKVTYTGKTSTTFTGCSGVTSVHALHSAVKPYVIEISTSLRGTTPTWSILNEGDEFDIDLETGRVHIYRDDLVLETLTYSIPPYETPNRFRASYLWGNETIPSDINRLTLMIASRDLLHKAVRKAHVNGLNNFEPSMIDVDKEWIEATKGKYFNAKSQNT